MTEISGARGPHLCSCRSARRTSW